MIRRFWHGLMHRMWWVAGSVTTWREVSGGRTRFMSGFRCRDCGAVSHAHEVPRQISHPEEFLR